MRTEEEQIVEEAGTPEIGEHHAHAPPWKQVAGRPEGQGEIGAPSPRSHVPEPSEEGEHVGLPLARGDDIFHLIREKEGTHPVVVLESYKREDGEQNLETIELAVLIRAGSHAPGHIHHEEEDEFPLLTEDLGVRFSETGGHVPIDEAYIVPGHVRPHLLEIHPLSLEDRTVVPRIQPFEDDVREEGKLSDPGPESERVHTSSQGTGTCSRRASITLSASMSSASAS